MGFYLELYVDKKLNRHSPHKVIYLVEKNCQLKYYFLDAPIVGPQKNVMVIAFRVALLLNVEIALFVCQRAVFVNLQHTNTVLDKVNFKS